MSMIRPSHALAAIPIVALLAVSAPAGDGPGMTAEAALSLLKTGNEHFVSGELEHPHLDADRRTTTAAQGQTPIATVLTCSDSRVPVEHIFDAGIGDVFVIRVAGNVAGGSELGTVEYGTGHLHTPLLVVLGHSACGAVTAATERAEVGGHIAPLLEQIRPAVMQAHQANLSLAGPDLVKAAIRANVWNTVATTLTQSEEVRELVKEKKLQVVGALYDLATGQVEWLGPHPQESELLRHEIAQSEPAHPLMIFASVLAVPLAVALVLMLCLRFVGPSPRQ
jgi:carbonic anhydrase